MRQNRLKRIILLIVIGIIAGLVPSIMIGCDLIGVSIEKRIEYFLDDLNNNRPDAITNFHPTETADRLSGAISCGLPPDPCFWDTDFPVGVTSYTLGSIDDSVPLNVIVTINGPVGFGRGGTGADDFKFIMIADGTNWLIEELWYWGAPVSNIVQ